MPKHVRMSWRRVASFSIVLFLLFSFGPIGTVLASSSNPTTHKDGSKLYYLALGDSLAFGYQPNFDWLHGYFDDLSRDLSQNDGYNKGADMGCNGETSTTMLNGKCPYKQIQKYPYKGPQMEAAVDYLHAHAGHMGLVTLDIGANDTKGDVNLSNCTINLPQFMKDLATLDTNLTKTILPEIHAALMVNGKQVGRLIMINYYDPFVNLCPNTMRGTELVNAHLAHDLGQYGTLVDVFSRFGGAEYPNDEICQYTWMCQKVQDIHCDDWGYTIIAKMIEDALEHP